MSQSNLLIISVSEICVHGTETQNEQMKKKGRSFMSALSESVFAYLI